MEDKKNISFGNEYMYLYNTKNKQILPFSETSLNDNKTIIYNTDLSNLYDSKENIQYDKNYNNYDDSSNNNKNESNNLTKI